MTDGRVAAWNCAAERAYGWPAAEVIGVPLPIVADGARAPFLASVARVLAGEAGGPTELACTFRDGSARRLRFRATSLRDEGAAPAAVFLECDEQEHQDRFQAVLDAIPAPIWFKDLDGVYRGCNGEFERYLGVSRDGIVGASVYDVAPGDLADVYRRADLAIFRDGGTQIYENQVAWADGTRRRVIFRKAAIRDAAGRVTGLAGTMLDVTELRAAERELRSRLAQQAALTRLAAGALDEEDPLRLVEKAVQLTVGAHAADGGGIAELSEEGGRRFVRLTAAVGPRAEPGAVPLDDDPIASRVVAAGLPLVVDDVEAAALALPAPLREARVASLAAVLVGPRDAPLGVLALFSRKARRFSAEDVQSLEATAAVLAIALGRGRARAERRLAQERLARAERLASIGTLAAGVAHELNNPLTFVLSNIGFVADHLRRISGAAPEPDRAEEALRALDEALEGAGRMRVIVRDLRTLARADDVRDAAVDVRRVVEYAANLAASEVRRRARLTWDLGVVPPVRGSEPRLGQVLLNLIVNAAHAIPEGAPDRNEIRITARREDDGRVAITVSDTGTGIPPELRTRIFDPFFTTKPVGLGTGLGLWVCHNIVVAHGGTIDVESATDGGTTFRILLQAAGLGLAADAEDEPLLPAARRRVLVVDDEPLVVATVRRQLGSGFAVDAASGPTEALARLAGSQRYDAIVSDVGMPDGGGLGLLEGVRRTAPDLAGRVVFVTGGIAGDYAARLAATGCPLLEKPFDGAQLRAALRALLG